ncbi:MAG: hypothetical protein ACTSQ0_02950 [Candidatus Heimdallarchaeota archaeon]
MNWGKTQKIIASIVGLITIFAAGFVVYNHFAKQSAHAALAANVETNYVQQSELVAMNKNVQQTNYDFWIYRIKQEISDLYKELRKTVDKIKQQQIQDEIEMKKDELKNYNKKLDGLKEGINE